MRMMKVTAENGDRRTLSPIAVIGWKAADVPANDPANPNKVYAGTLIRLLDGSNVGVRESVDQIHFIWARAVGGETFSLAMPILDQEEGEDARE